MKVVATHSFRGGSGKTFIALNMASASARSDVKTIVMDCDFNSPSFQSNIVKNSGGSFYANDFLLGNCQEEDIISHTSNPNLDVIFSNPKPELGKGLLDSKEEIHWKALQRFTELRKSLEEQDYKRFILDTTPTLSFSSISALAVADSIILVHRPVLHSIDLAIYILSTIYASLEKSLKQRLFYLVYNQVPMGTDDDIEHLLNTLTREFRKHLDLKLLGSIPLDTGMDLWNTLLIPDGWSNFDIIDQMNNKIFSY